MFTKEDPIKKVLKGLDKTLPGLSEIAYDTVKKNTTKKDRNYLKVGAGLYLAAKKDEETKLRKRKPFSKLNQRKAKERQKNRCYDCHKKSEFFEFHHSNGDRTNNSLENCAALCPNCHAKRHRKKKFKQVRKRKKWFGF